MKKFKLVLIFVGLFSVCATARAEIVSDQVHLADLVPGSKLEIFAPVMLCEKIPEVKVLKGSSGIFGKRYFFQVFGVKSKNLECKRSSHLLATVTRVIPTIYGLHVLFEQSADVHQLILSRSQNFGEAMIGKDVEGDVGQVTVGDLRRAFDFEVLVHAPQAD